MITMLAPERQAQLERLQWRAFGVGAAALVVCIVGAVFSPTQFFRAYLTAYLFYLGLAHGALAILMLYHLTGGAWGFLIRRPLEAAMRTLPLLAVLFIPIAWGIGYLYPWAHPEAVAADPELAHKQVYLNPTFFWVRCAIYFVAWLGLAWWLSALSRREDRTGAPAYRPWLARVSGAGLAIFGVTVTFASVDWIMSLQPSFRSTIFGALFATGEILSAHAGALIVLAWLVWRTHVDDAASIEALNDLGNLLFTFLIIWGYMGYFQFMLIWIANLPYDISWYLDRGRNGWQYVGVALFVLQFSIPFGMLLMRDVKQHPARLAGVAGLILAMHLVYQYWQVMPAFAADRLSEHWLDFFTPVALGGFWFGAFLWHFRTSPVLPCHDEPNRDEALRLHAEDVVERAREQEVHHG